MDEDSMPDFLYKKEDICRHFVIQSIYYKTNVRLASLNGRRYELVPYKQRYKCKLCF